MCVKGDPDLNEIGKLGLTVGLQYGFQSVRVGVEIDKTNVLINSTYEMLTHTGSEVLANKIFGKP